MTFDLRGRPLGRFDIGIGDGVDMLTFGSLTFEQIDRG